MSDVFQQGNYSGEESRYLNEFDICLTDLTHTLYASRKPIASTKFSADSAVFLHILTSVLPDIPVIWVDTGYNTRDTLQFATYLESHLNLNLKIYRPAEINTTIPPELGTREHDAFTHATKLAPFQQAIKEFEPDLWLSSLRRYQSSHRSTLTAREVIDEGLVKYYPFLEWSANAIEFYRNKYALPTGPTVYDPTKGLPLRECGLHTKLWSAVGSVESLVR